MVQAIIRIGDHEDRVLTIVKGKYGLKNKSEYFFRYDGHPNEKGYEEIAKYIGKQLIEQGILRKE